MHRYRELMVGLARANADAGLIRYAAMVAELGTAERVRCVHVLPNSSRGLPECDHDRVQAELQANVQPYCQDLSEDVEVSCDMLHGPLMDQLLAYTAERQVDVLFVGHGLSVPTRHARPATGHEGPLFDLDGARRRPQYPPPHPRSDRLLRGGCRRVRVATSLARLGGHAECLALHVYFNEAVATYEGYDEVMRGQEQQTYRQFIAPINCQGVKVKPLFEEGVNVAQVIGRVVEQHHVDLIVMATRGRSRSAAILLGSVTEETVLATRVPLLAVKHFGARLGVLQALLDRRFRQGGNLHTD